MGFKLLAGPYIFPRDGVEVVDPLEGRQLGVDSTPLKLPNEDIEDGLQVQVGVGLQRPVLLTRPDQLHQLLVDEVGQFPDSWKANVFRVCAMAKGVEYGAEGHGFESSYQHFLRNFNLICHNVSFF